MEKLNILANAMNTDFYNWLKIEYGDICGYNDALINKIIDEIYFNKNVSMNDLQIIYTSYSYRITIQQIINYLYDDYSRFDAGEEPDPFF